MKIQWIAAAVLSSALLTACGDKSADNAQNAPENQGTAVTLPPESAPPPALAPAPEPAPLSPNRDTTPPRADTSGSRPPSGNRTPSRPAAAPPRADTAPAPEPVRDGEPAPAPAPPRVTVRSVTLPVGTDLPLELTTAVSTETASVEMPVTARLRRAVSVDGVTVLPAGAIVNGEVSDVSRPGRVQGRARLGLRFTSVTVDGRREEIRSNPVVFEGEQTKGEDATKIGAGAGIGAIIGGIIGGGDGAAKGAAIGGAAGTGAVLATRGRDVALQSGAEINASLATPAEIVVR